MTGKIFKEYLLWFDGQMAGRQVLLLIDGFSAHHAGLNLFHEEYPAWEQDVSTTTIENCWVKSQVLSARYGPRNQEEANNLGWNDRVQEAEEVERSVQRDVEQGVKELARQHRISQSMAIGQFLNPSEEEVDDESDEIVEVIAKAYSIGDRTHETDEEDVVMPRVSHAEAL